MPLEQTALPSSVASVFLIHLNYATKQVLLKESPKVKRVSTTPLSPGNMYYGTPERQHHEHTRVVVTIDAALVAVAVATSVELPLPEAETPATAYKNTREATISKLNYIRQD